MLSLARGREGVFKLVSGYRPEGDQPAAIEALLRAVGAESGEGAGSRARIALGGVRAVFHRPHPSPEAKRGLVRAVQDFLAAAGVKPEEE